MKDRIVESFRALEKAQEERATLPKREEWPDCPTLWAEWEFLATCREAGIDPSEVEKEILHLN